MNAKNGLRVLAIVVAITLPWLTTTATPNRAAEEGISVQVYELNRADAESIAKVLQTILPAVTNDIRITVDETRNAILVVAPEERHKIVRELLLKLDRPTTAGERAEVPRISQDKVAAMSDEELRRLVWHLHERVVQLEEKTSLRIMPVRER